MQTSQKLFLCLGIILAIAHLVILAFAVDLIFSKAESGQWPLVWFIFIYLDFPFSLLYFIVGPLFFIVEFFLPIHLLIRDFLGIFLPWPITDFNNFLLPFFFFGILGTAWYFFLPRLIYTLLKGLVRFIRELVA